MCKNLQNGWSSSDDEFVASQHKKSSKATPAKQVHTHSTSMLSGIDQSAVWRAAKRLRDDNICKTHRYIHAYPCLRTHDETAKQAAKRPRDDGPATTVQVATLERKVYSDFMSGKYGDPDVFNFMTVEPAA